MRVLLIFILVVATIQLNGQKIQFERLEGGKVSVKIEGESYGVYYPEDVCVAKHRNRFKFNWCESGDKVKIVPLNGSLDYTSIDWEGSTPSSVVPDNNTDAMESIMNNYFNVEGSPSDMVVYFAYSGIDDTSVSQNEYLQSDDLVGQEDPHHDTHGITFNSSPPYNPVIPRDGVYKIVYKLSIGYDNADEAFAYNMTLDGVRVDRHWVSINNNNAGESSQQVICSYMGPLTTLSEIGLVTSDMSTGNDVTVTNMTLSIIEVDN